MNINSLKIILLAIALTTSSLAHKGLTQILGVEVRVAYISIVAFALLSFVTKDCRRLTLSPLKRIFSTHFYTLYLPMLSLLTYYALSVNPLSLGNVIKTNVSVLIFLFALLGIVEHVTSDRLFRIYIAVVKASCLFTLFEQFLWVAFKIEASGVLQSWFIGFHFRGEDGIFMRVHAWYREPAFFAQVISLAVIMLFSQIGKPFNPKFPEAKSKFWGVTIVLSSIMTFSLSGMIAFVCGGFLLLRRLKHWPIALSIAILLSLATQLSQSINERIFALAATDYTENLSVYAYVSNALAAINSFYDYPLGRGLGNHYLAHQDWLALNPSIAKLEFRSLNALDGGSLITRLISELGAGAVVFFFIWSFQTLRAFVNVTKKDLRYDLRVAALLAIYCYAMRQGSYTLFELWFFVALFCSANGEIKGTLPESKIA